MADSTLLRPTMIKKKSMTAYTLPVWSFVLASMVATVLMIDPTRAGWGSSRVPWLKYLPIELSAVAIGLDLARRQRWRFAWPEYFLGVLFVWMLGGSMYSITVNGNDLMHSWLGRSLNMISFLAGYRIFNRRRTQMLVARKLGKILLAAFWAMLCITVLYVTDIAWQDLPQVYHIEAAFILSVVTTEYIANARKFRHFWWGGFLVTAFALIRVGKFSTYIFISVALVSILIYELYKYDLRMAANTLSKKSLRLSQIGLTLALICFSVLLARNVVYARIKKSVPVRQRTFTERVAMWSESPLMGTNFVGSPVLSVDSLLIPAHSDWLDLMAFGGVVGMVLFSLPLLRYIWKVWESIPQIARYPLPIKRIVVFSTIYLVMMMISMMVNPFLEKPALSFWFWASAGVLAAVFKEDYR